MSKDDFLIFFVFPWVVLQLALMFWASKHSTDGRFLSREYPHISHVISWLTLGAGGAVLTYGGVVYTGENGPAFLFIWNAWCLWQAYLSFKSLIKDESRDV